MSGRSVGGAIVLAIAIGGAALYGLAGYRLPFLQAPDIPATNSEFDPAPLALGQLNITAPTGLLQSPSWIYVNGQLVSKLPPPSSGVADDPHNYARITLRVPPGSYRVEFMTSGAAAAAFPFALSTFTVRVEQGRAVSANMPLPAGYRPDSAGVLGARQSACQDNAHQWIVATDQQMEGLEADPVASSLFGVVVGINPYFSDPHQKPASYRDAVGVDLPASIGGPRELDDTQIRMINSRLRDRYSFVFDNNDEAACRNAAPNDAALITQIAERHQQAVAVFEHIDELASWLAASPET